MLEQLDLHDLGPAPSMQFSFTPRLNLFTGDNGLGKTFVLDVVWFALTGTWPRFPAVPRRGANAKPTIAFTKWQDQTRYELVSSFDFVDQRWRRSVRMENASNADLVIYARVDGGITVWDPYRPAEHLPPPFGKMAFSLGVTAVDSIPGFRFTPDEVWYGLELNDRNHTVVCNGLIRDWALWQLQQNIAFEILTRVLEVLSPGPQETIRPGTSTVRVFSHDVRDIPTIDLPYGSVPVLLASAGMRRILAFAYLLVWMWREHIEAAKLRNTTPITNLVILVDEVEAHLNPQWQHVILPAVLRVARELGRSMNIQVFATTHSPLVLASVEPPFDEARDALFVFDIEEGQVMSTRTPWAL